jgi:hypothetical protein
MVVWGGAGAGGTIPANGETYDPVTNTWSALPRAPLRAREEAAAVWSGTDVIIVGGTDARTLDANHTVVLHDGAALTPGSVPAQP